MNTSAWQQASNVLCVRLDNLGDVLMTTPAMRALRDSVPGRRITLLASSSGTQAAQYLGEIDDVITYDSPWMKSTAGRSNLPDWGMLKTLKARRFHAAVIFTVYTQSALPAALLCWMAGIPLRLAHCHENPYQLLTDWVHDFEPQQRVRHEVKRQLDLVGAIGCHTADQRLSFRIPQAAHERAMAKLSAAGVQIERPWLVLHPGASAASRRYPPAQYAAAAQVLVIKHGWQVLFTGSREENELVESIRRSMKVPTASLAGELDLGELGGLISQARVVLTNNSGPAHIAAAVGTPVVDLYALTNPQHTPWAVPSRVLFHDVPCKFCYKSVCPQGHHRCLRMISPLQVVNAVQELADATDTGVAPASLPGTLPGHWRTPPSSPLLPASHVYPGN